MTLSFSSRIRPAHRVSIGAAILVLSLALVPAGCKRHKPVTARTVEEAPPLASTIATADSRTAAQLVSGFYGIEQNSWRWTAGRFSVLLHPPQNAGTKGAMLQLKFAIPDVSLAKLKTITLTAYVNGTPLPPETYTQAGQFLFSREVPANLLVDDTARIDFSVDKTMPPTPADRRELGVVVSMVGLQPK
ncbi:MAG: hypothetical protein ABSC93_31285 [Bryobacteraceae bacterium]|jgi:hypothetical protein